MTAITKQNIDNLNVVIQFLLDNNLKRTWPSSIAGYEKVALNAYMKLIKNGARRYLVLDYPAIEAAFNISKDEIKSQLTDKGCTKFSWAPYEPQAKELTVEDHDIIVQEIESAPEFYIFETARGYAYNYLRLIIFASKRLKKVVTRQQLTSMKKPTATSLMNSEEESIKKILAWTQQLSEDGYRQLLERLPKPEDETLD